MYMYFHTFYLLQDCCRGCRLERRVGQEGEGEEGGDQLKKCAGGEDALNMYVYIYIYI